MSVSAVATVPHDSGPVPHSAPQRIGAPEPLGRNAARTVAASQGHVWQARGATGAVAEHAEAFVEIDRRGDMVRAQIWRHVDAALAALKAGDGRTAVAELHSARGLRPLYEEADTLEGEHCAAMAAQAGGAHTHLGASAVMHAHLLSAGVGQ